jgi:EAL and modified HD-GYP domain-containing signal transduction protein
MTDSARFEPAAQALRVRDFYLGRQPMLDRNQALFGYELLFRNAPLGPAHITSGLSATASVIAHAAQLGLHKAIGDATGFLNVDADVLMGDIFAFLPREQIVLELVDSVQASDPMLERIAQLASHGFRFSLDDVVSDSVKAQRLLPLVDFVKVDLHDAARAALPQLVSHFQREGKKLIAENVETRDEYKVCLDMGFDYFQGYYFARPVVLGGRKLSPSQLTIVELMTLVTSDAENIDIERAVKRDAPVALNLLRLVNTPAVGARQRIDSLSHAVMILGRRQLQRWLQIMLYAEPATRGHNMTPLLMLATTRARLMELLAQRLRPSQRNVAEIAFTVGIMSLMDTLFEMPMANLLEQIPVIGEVEHALLHRSGFFGELLRLAESIECMDDADDAVMPTLRELDIAGDDLAELEMAAFAWSDSVVRYAI